MEKFALYTNKRVLVTGGAGFIGSHLVHKLVALDANVTVLDNFSSGSRDNLTSVIDHISLIEGNIADQQTCLVATQNISYVFHLAAAISVPDSMKHPLQYNKTNVTGIINILEASKINNIKHVIFSSSSAVYGQLQTTCHEEVLCKPVSMYGLSKLIGEQYCKLYADTYALNTTCLRYFNVHGERQNPHGHYAAAVAKFKYQLQHHEPITIFGNGNQTRDFIAVEDVVTANLILALDSPAQGMIYNIATGNSITILELTQRLQKEHGSSRSSIQFAPAREGDIYRSQAQCTKYQNALKRILT